MDRIFNINKPKGMTSHDVVYKVRKILGIKKVGHTGTLDPDAIGVLPICVGRATKVSDLILNKDKEYECEMILGIETDTYDSSGKVIFEKEIKGITEEDVKKALLSQIGEIDQYPPIYSALKINGEKMCDIARSGRADEIIVNPRRIEIKNIEILSIDLPKVLFKVECSKGTYIRSICHDVGADLEIGAHMTYLKRIKSGIFEYDNTITLQELEKYKQENRLIEHSFSIEETLSEFPYLILNNNAVKYYSNGGVIESNRFIDGDYFEKSKRVRVYTPDRDFIGIGILNKDNDKLWVKSEKIFRLG